MISFLFWNLRERPLVDRVVRLVSNYGINVLLLAECNFGPGELESALTDQGCDPLRQFDGSVGKVRLYFHLPKSSITLRFRSMTGNSTAYRLKLHGRPDLLLFLVHLPSRRDWSRDDQTLYATEVARDIERIEAREKHQRTVLVGDLNMNPFDPGVVGALALHAVMSKDVARRRERSVRGTSYRLFYNPMWGCFGDRTDGPPGTFYFGSAMPNNVFWNIYDQLLLRPDLVDSLGALRIMDTDGYDSLLTSGGRPDVRSGSDHLPILFRLAL